MLRCNKSIPLHVNLRLAHLRSQVFEILVKVLLQELLLKLQLFVIIDQIVKFERVHSAVLLLYVKPLLSRLPHVVRFRYLLGVGLVYAP